MSKFIRWGFCRFDRVESYVTVGMEWPWDATHLDIKTRIS